jgi:hypothetical protein
LKRPARTFVRRPRTSLPWHRTFDQRSRTLKRRRRTFVQRPRTFVQPPGRLSNAPGCSQPRRGRRSIRLADPMGQKSVLVRGHMSPSEDTLHLLSPTGPPHPATTKNLVAGPALTRQVA